ncbi:hypothetical protein DRE_04167 [Drechslerella stenobrocha 248]|uniref:Uncharacterized protein n=1 Tax=Drechslerella stenobrocha 248 TaxID=1043628 RepID=W7IC61_9PEZI|nr:hypothetical protein DRE_04167 [Drechslerella stenobrocha 248]
MRYSRCGLTVLGIEFAGDIWVAIVLEVNRVSTAIRIDLPLGTMSSVATTRRYCDYSHLVLRLADISPAIECWREEANGNDELSPRQLGDWLQTAISYFIDGDDDVRHSVFKALSSGVPLERLKLCMSPMLLPQRWPSVINYPDHVAPALRMLSDPVVRRHAKTMVYARDIYAVVMNSGNHAFWSKVLDMLDETFRMYPFRLGSQMNDIITIFVNSINFDRRNVNNPIIQQAFSRIRLHLEILMDKRCSGKLSPSLLGAFSVFQEAVSSKGTIIAEAGASRAGLGANSISGDLRARLFENEQGDCLFRRWLERGKNPERLNLDWGNPTNSNSMKAFLKATLHLVDCATLSAKHIFLSEYLLREPWVSKLWECLMVELPVNSINQPSPSYSDHVSMTMQILSHDDIVGRGEFSSIRAQMSRMMASQPNFLYGIQGHLKARFRNKACGLNTMFRSIKSIATVIDGVFKFLGDKEISIDFRYEAEMFLHLAWDLESRRLPSEKSCAMLLKTIGQRVASHSKKFPITKEFKGCSRRQKDEIRVALDSGSQEHTILHFGGGMPMNFTQSLAGYLVLGSEAEDYEEERGVDDKLLTLLTRSHEPGCDSWQQTSQACWMTQPDSSPS